MFECFLIHIVYKNRAIYATGHLSSSELSLFCYATGMAGYATENWHLFRQNTARDPFNYQLTRKENISREVLTINCRI